MGYKHPGIILLFFIMFLIFLFSYLQEPGLWVKYGFDTNSAILISNTFKNFWFLFFIGGIVLIMLLIYKD